MTLPDVSADCPKMPKSCDCKSANNENGTTPAVIFTSETGRKYAVDACIAPVIAHLHGCGFTTMASCCGHGIQPPSVIIDTWVSHRELLRLISEVDSRLWSVERVTKNTPPSDAAEIVTQHEKTIGALELLLAEAQREVAVAKGATQAMQSVISDLKHEMRTGIAGRWQTEAEDCERECDELKAALAVMTKELSDQRVRHTTAMMAERHGRKCDEMERQLAAGAVVVKLPDHHCDERMAECYYKDEVIAALKDKGINYG